MTWVPWQSAWHRSLYGDRGFYRSVGGPAEHFSTSAQGIPGGTALLARAVLLLAQQHGLRRIVDFACGRGELAAQIALLAPNVTVVAVDIVDRPDGLPDSVEWVRSDGAEAVPASLDRHDFSDHHPGDHHSSDRDTPGTLVLAHEWLDVVPCPVLIHDGEQLRVVEVDEHGAERWGAAVDPADLDWCQAYWPGWDSPHARIEVGRTRDAAYARLRATISHGLLVTVDYGHLRDARPLAGTLIGYRDGAPCVPLPDARTDITAHVAMDSLGAQQVLRQRELFEHLGLRPTKPDVRLAAVDPPAYLRALVAVGGYSTLTSPGGLGDFWWSLDVVRPRPDAARR